MLEMFGVWARLQGHLIPPYFVIPDVAEVVAKERGDRHT